MQTRHRYPTRRAAFALALAACALFAGPPALAGDHSTVVTVTAYNSVPSQTRGRPNVGAWGDTLGRYDIAVSPDLVKRGLDNGTVVAIAGFHHHFIVRDKTAADVRNTIDIFMGKDVARARRFGHKKRRIWWYTADR